MTSPVNIWIALIVLAVSVNSCNTGSDRKVGKTEKTLPSVEAVRIAYSIAEPAANQTFKIGDVIQVTLRKSSSAGVDSLRTELGPNLKKALPAEELKFELPGRDLKPGITRLKLNIYLTGGEIQDLSIPLKFLSDIKPKEYTYRIISEFPHDIKAYTQGFEFDNDFFYEGTGQYGESYLRKVVFNTGEIIKSASLSQDLFGEGITLLNGKIYQITYRNQVGFVYDMETFNQLRKIYYQNREGWGLTNNGKEILMSDGTNIIYFMDPDYFSVVRKIEVFDNMQEVDSLNELEYIDGLIYANRFLTDQIVMIDPESGKVLGRADMKGLLRKEDRISNTDVLNGIAWDKKRRRLFVTGKYWPKVFHVDLIPK